jgi:general secretion pathway protein G
MAEPSSARGVGSAPAFTLLEILVVVVILGILAAIVSVAFADSAESARRTAFIGDVRVFRDAAFVFYAEQRHYPEDSGSGEVPAGFEDYIDADKWTDLTPLGGVWDFERDSFGITSGFGVDFANGDGMDRDDDYMTLVDEVCDNGDLASGSFRKIADGRYYEIIVP